MVKEKYITLKKETFKLPKNCKAVRDEEDGISIVDKDNHVWYYHPSLKIELRRVTQAIKDSKMNGSYKYEEKL